MGPLRKIQHGPLGPVPLFVMTRHVGNVVLRVMAAAKAQLCPERPQGQEAHRQVLVEVLVIVPSSETFATEEGVRMTEVKFTIAQGAARAPARVKGSDASTALRADFSRWRVQITSVAGDRSPPSQQCSCYLIRLAVYS